MATFEYIEGEWSSFEEALINIFLAARENGVSYQEAINSLWAVEGQLSIHH